MLTAFQETKLRLFFNVLDYDRNGFIDYEDFESIGENICLILEIEDNDDMHEIVMNACYEVWKDVSAYIDTNKDSKASTYEWLKYADEKIVNVDQAEYDNYVTKVVDHIFLLFDDNKDDYISLKEYINLFMTFRLEIRYSAKAFVKIDLDQDNLINREELHLAVEQFLKSDDKSQRGNWLFGSWEELAI